MAVIALLVLLFIKPVKNVLNLSDQVKSGSVLTANQVQPAVGVQNADVVKSPELIPGETKIIQNKELTDKAKKEVELVSRVNAARFQTHEQIAFMELKVFPKNGKPGGL
jgi:hypothetical protein